jgi:hypothetical protein
MVWDWIRRSMPVRSAVDPALLDTIADMGGVDRRGALRLHGALRDAARLGPDLAAATEYLMACKVAGLSRGRAACIAAWICAVAKAPADRHQWADLGFTEGKWLSSGGLCTPRWRAPTREERLTADIHRRLSGTVYPLDRGVMINGELVHPGTMPGCTCVSGPVVPGFD